MSADRTGDGDGDAKPRGLSLAAIAGVLLALASLMLPALWALSASSIGVVLGVVGYRQARRDPRTGPLWVSVVAIIVGAVVFASQVVFLVIFPTE